MSTDVPFPILFELLSCVCSLLITPLAILRRTKLFAFPSFSECARQVSAPFVLFFRPCWAWLRTKYYMSILTYSLGFLCTVYIQWVVTVQGDFWSNLDLQFVLRNRTQDRRDMRP